MSRQSIVTLLTDFTLRDPHVGVMKGVILSISPDSRVVDLTHDVEAFQIGSGAFLLERSYRYFPRGTVHVGVVDPGVGSERRAVAAHVDGHFFVAPDNGLLTDVLREAGDRGQDVRIVQLTRGEYWLDVVSPTFHGRDLFSPVGAHLARGVPLEHLGEPCLEIVMLADRSPRRSGGGVEGKVIHIDRFGNLITNIRPSDLAGMPESEVRVQVKDLDPVRLCRTYSSVPPGETVSVVGG